MGLNQLPQRFFILLFFIFPACVFAKNRIYLAENTAVIAIVPVTESSFNLQITLNLQDSFTNWDLGFFMLRVLLDDKKQPFTAQVCKQSTCVPLVLDVLNKSLPANQADYLKPELSAGHISLLTPTQPFQLGNEKTTAQESSTYIININGLTRIPQNITAMPQSLFLLSANHKGIIPVKVTAYTGYDTLSAESQQQARNRFKWYALNSPEIIDSVVVPYPVQTTYTSGVYKLNSNINAHYCVAGESVPLCKAINGKPEGYVLQVIPSGVTIYTNTSAGIFYARQTLAQLANYYANNIPAQTVVDYPRFKYRGLMLDTARHFFSVAEIKQLLDVMAAHKLNVLHLHLSDDEAWRIELPHYPQLTAIGSKRVLGGILGPSNLVDGKYDVSNFTHADYASADTLYQGYYSVIDMQELIKYANTRQITIIPEIEMPAHAKALKKSLPQIFFDAADKSRYFSVQGYNDSVLPVCKYGNDLRFTATVNGIITDIAGIFAGQTTLNFTKNEVSLSGDEVPPTAFSEYTMCNNGVYKNLTGESIAHEFFKQVSVNLPDYKLSGWQQLIQADDGNIYSNAQQAKNTGHIWQWLPTNSQPVSGLTMTANLSRAGYPTVLDFANLSYFDQRYSSDWNEPGLYWAANQTDTFSALTSALVTQHITDTANIIGIEGALWSELIPGKDHLFYMALPKMSGLADASWSDPRDISWRSLAVRLGCGQTGFLAYLSKQYNVRYRGYPNGIKLEVPDKKLCN